MANLNDETNLIMKSDENEKYEQVKDHLTSKFSEFRTKRKLTEMKWLRNQRQYDGVYEQEIVKDIAPGRSKVYNKVTTAKIDQFKSRMSELTMPAADKNYGLNVSENPRLSKDVVNSILQGLNDIAKQSLAQYNQAQSQGQQAEPPIQITKEIIEQAVKTEALKRSKKMENVIFDQLIETKYVEIISKVLFSSAVFGPGIVKGPYYIEEKKVNYEQDEMGNWVAKEKMVSRPYIEHVKVWDFFPDMDAKDTDIMDGAFFYHTMTKQDLKLLADRSDFLGDNIIDYIKANKKGNFVYEWYETALYSTAEEQILYSNNKYRLKEYWGSVPASMLKDVFDDIEDEDILVEVNIWMIDNVIIKCVKNPYDSQTRPFYLFNYKKSDASILGTGLCDLLEELQRGINSVTRAIHDNMSYIAGPIIEINRDLIPAGQKIDRLYPGKIVWRDGQGAEANYPAIRSTQITSHIGDLLSLEKSYRDKIDDVSSLTAIMSGDMQNQATLGRTSSGIQQVMGAANIVLREVTKQFDFFNEKLLTLMVEWNMMFNDDDSCKGDYQIFPRVSTALIEKQLTANALVQMVQTLQPEQRTMIDWEEILRSQLTSNNLDPDKIILSKDKQQQLQQQQQQAQQQQIQAQQQQVQAQQQLEQEKVSADSMLKNAKAQQLMNDIQIAKSKDNLDTIKQLHEVDMDRQNQESKDNQLKYNIIKDSINHGENINKQLIDSKLNNNGKENE